MDYRRRTLWASLILSLVVVLSGCAPRAAAQLYVGGALSTQSLDLPALVVDIDAAGQASVSNMPVAQLAAMAGLAPSAFSIPAEWMTFLTASNIQHVQVQKTDNNLLVLINGEAIPSLAWDGESLTATRQVLSDFGIAIPMLDQYLPLLDLINMAVIVRFPISAGETAIPLFVESNDAVALVQQAQEQLAVAGATHLTVPVYYQPDGSWSVGDLTSAELSAMTGISFYALELRPHAIDALARAGIRQLNLSTNAEGIRIAVNGRVLPTISWRNGELANLVNLTADLTSQYNLLELVAPGMNTNEIMATVRELLPVVIASDFELVVHMPAGLASTR